MSKPSSPSCSPKTSGGCTALEIEKLADFQSIVAHYRRYVVPDVELEQLYFQDVTSVDAALDRACLSIDRDGNLHSHQRRVGHSRLSAVATEIRTLRTEIVAAKSFAQLHKALWPLRKLGLGFGELAHYDIAERIGWFRGLKPDRIYLHRGTKEGARLFASDWRDATMPTDSPCLPVEFRKLSAAHLENLLCMYKAPIRKILASLK